MKKIKLFYVGLITALCLTLNLHADDAAITNYTQAILQHPNFREPLVWVGAVEPSETESAQLWQILQTLSQPGWTTKVEQFLLLNPNSPWSASLHHAYASFCHRNGRTTKALEHWQAGWQLVRTDTSAAGKRVGGEILANWMEQLSSLGRRDQLKELIALGDSWPFVNPQDREKFEAARNNYFLMGKHPEMSFRCGTLALKAVGQVLQPTNTTLEALVEMPSPTNGFSMAALTNLAAQYGLALIAVRRTQGDDLIVPSVVHWRQNHYAAILEYKEGNYLVNDPTFGKPKWMSADAINEEASGAFLIPGSKQNNDWQPLAGDALSSIRGKGLPNNVNDGKDKGCTVDSSGQLQCPACTGMPVWWVSEPYINVWVADEPLSYVTSLGEPFTFRTTFKQRDTRPTIGLGVPNTGWNNSWVSFIQLESDVPCAGTCSYPPYNNSDAILYLPNGGAVYFPSTQRYDSETRLLLQMQYPELSSSLAAGWNDSDGGLRVIHADGAQDIYGFGVSANGVAGDYALYYYERTRQIDPHGNTTSFYYLGTNAQYVLQYVVDYDGHTNSLYYVNNASIGHNLLVAVTNAYGQSAHFQYDGNGNLTNITDAISLSSQMTYDSNGYPTSLVTPYGTNQFTLFVNSLVANTNNGEGNFGGDDVVDRAAQVTDPVGGTHLYLYRYDCSQFMATNYASSDIPTNTPLGTLDGGTGGTNSLCGVDYRNSFAWNARQYASLSTTNLASLSTNDFIRGRMRHWLQDTNDLVLSGYLSVERKPSPDGTAEGLKTFFDYAGKIYPHRAGTNGLPSVIAWCLPGRETHYDYVRFDYFGNVTNQVTTYTTATGAWATRTNQYFYQDNVYTNVLGNTDGHGNIEDTVTNTFTIPDLPVQTIAANGSNNWTYGGYDVITWTNNFLISGGIQTNQTLLTFRRVLPDYKTNALGQVTTQAFTGFDKLASIQWPSGLSKTNIYNPNGFLVQTIEPQIHRTNAYAYSNGLLSAFTNELGLAVNFSWDNLLRLTGATLPDATTYSNIYTALDVTAKKDRIGHWNYFSYDGLRHLIYLTNANNAVTSYGWCDCGSLTEITDALTNITTLNYDFQSRLTNISRADGSSINYQYDAAGRKTNIFDGLGKAVALAYNNQGLPTNINNSYGAMLKVIFDTLDRPIRLTDANNVTTTNSYDMLNRLLTRVWTADGIGESFVYATNGLIAYTNRNNQGTHYARDAASRLIAVTNANMQVTQFAYDPAGHLTNLIDGLIHGTTWIFNQYGWLTNKTDASNHTAAIYSYNANGWLTNRWLPATGNTAYAFDAVGNLTNITYPAAQIAYGFDALNRLTNMVDAVGTTAFGYTPAGELASESNPFSSLNGVISFLYSQGQRTNLSLSEPAGAAWTQSYAYDNAWRLTNLTAPSGSFGYGYAASASPLVQGLSLPNAASITYQYDSLARLTNTSLAAYWGNVLDGYGYGYDALGQRTNMTRNLGLTASQISAAYDNIGQLIAWNASETNGVPRQNEQLEYGYDAAGNLLARTNSALAQSFAVDALNQLSTATRSGALTLTGATPAPVTNLTVNGVSAQTYGDFTFAATNLTLANGNNTFTSIATNLYGVGVTNSFTVNLPASVAFQYDGNGNLTNDGTRNFVYDAENQATNINVAGQWKTEFVFDGLRRKRIERDYTWSSGWVKTNETHYLYDGMLVIQERDTNNNVLVTYTRGLDLSRSRQGAGGIGGMLARTDTNGSVFYHSDGAGNITALIDGNQNLVGRYEYDAFGKLIGKWGALADANTYRFSSKEYQRSSGLYYFGFRFYDPNFQRWLNHDPIGERGGFNLYNIAGNSPLNLVDVYGLAPQLSSISANSSGQIQSATYSQSGSGAPDYTENFYDLSMALYDQIKQYPPDPNAAFTDATSNNGLQGTGGDWLAVIFAVIQPELDLAIPSASASAAADAGANAAADATKASATLCPKPSKPILSPQEAISPTARKFLNGNIPLSQVPTAEAQQAAEYLQNVVAPAARDDIDAAYQQARAQALLGQGNPPGPISTWRANRGN